MKLLRILGVAIPLCLALAAIALYSGIEGNVGLVVVVSLLSGSLAGMATISIQFFLSLMVREAQAIGTLTYCLARLRDYQSEIDPETRHRLVDSAIDALVDGLHELKGDK